MEKFYKGIISFISGNLIKNNTIILFGSLIAGFINYLYNFAMIRMLNPVEYAEIAALLSLFSIISIPASAIQISISRFSAEMIAEKNLEKLSYFIRITIKYFLNLGIACFALFLLIIPVIQSFLKMESSLPLIILSIFTILLFVTPVSLGSLQGTQKFTAYSISGITSTFLKLLSGIILVWLGFKELGAVAAIIIGSIISFLYAYYSLDLVKTKKTFSFDKSQIVKYSQMVLLSTFCITILGNIDIILIKHFWNPVDVANYSVLSLTGKIIFFVTSSAAFVMFPLIIDRHSQNKEHGNILKYSFLLVLTAGLAITTTYLIFSNFIINVLFGSAYLQIASYLGYFGLTMILFSLIHLLITYDLSINNSRFVLPVILGTIGEIILISFFHQNIGQIIMNLGIAMSFIFIMLLAPHIKYFYNKTSFN